jgi:hypothetical protein
VWRLAVALVATAVMGCSASGGAAPLASGAPPSIAPSPVASPIPSPVQPIVLSGTNSKVTDPMDIPPGNYRVSWQASYTGAYSDLFEVNIQGQSKTLLVNEVLPTTTRGEVLFTSLGGSFILDVATSSATWTITFTWLSP